MRKFFKICSVFFAILSVVFLVLLFFMSEYYEMTTFYALLLGSLLLLCFFAFMDSLIFRKALSKKTVVAICTFAVCSIAAGCTYFGVTSYNNTYRGINHEVFKEESCTLPKEMYPFAKEDWYGEFDADGVEGVYDDVFLYSPYHRSYYFKSKSPLLTKINSVKHNAFLGELFSFGEHLLESTVSEKKVIDGVKCKVFSDEYSTIAIKIDTINECFYSEYLYASYHDVSADEFIQAAVKQYKAVRTLGMDDYKEICGENWF